LTPSKDSKSSNVKIPACAEASAGRQMPNEIL